MMSKSRGCMFLLLNVLAGFLSVSGTGITLKYVCPGDTVQAIENIKFDLCNAIVNLSRNGDRNTEIATWSYQNCTLNATISPKYDKRVYLDPNGTITIQKFHHFDQAKYVAMSKMDPLPMIYEVQLLAMVAPAKACKPMIEKLGNRLIARLNAEYCGIPVAIPYWEGYGAVSNTNEAIIKVSPGKEAVTYSACIKGPAVACAINLTAQDYCSLFTIEGSNSPTIATETCNTASTITPETCNTAPLITVSIISVIVFIWAIAVTLRLIQIIRGRRNLKGKQTEQLLKSPPGTEHIEIPQLWKKHFDVLKWDDIKPLLNNDQQKDLQAYCDNSKSLRHGQQQMWEICCEREQETEESKTEHLPDTDPERFKELRELRDAAMCKICFTSKMNVCFMPCKHMATCSKCSIPLGVCPVCRATINEKMNIRFE
ncbi:hypothetical protein CHS0354_039304 [Potamilus streckersoni]|uniref:RING-type domain-containing protein n=1 Tax=Potamilus streckersoni TaxID=2493646 RepID=A0AAE0W4H9_9BIVA|nr:hypothetical protein CHS0354_039304 [Potamilus streckersoni]